MRLVTEGKGTSCSEVGACLHARRLGHLGLPGPGSEVVGQARDADEPKTRIPEIFGSRRDRIEVASRTSQLRTWRVTLAIPVPSFQKASQVGVNGQKLATDQLGCTYVGMDMLYAMADNPHQSGFENKRGMVAHRL
jgi:hypothetical protein